MFCVFFMTHFSMFTSGMLTCIRKLCIKMRMKYAFNYFDCETVLLSLDIPSLFRLLLLWSEASGGRWWRWWEWGWHPEKRKKTVTQTWNQKNTRITACLIGAENSTHRAVLTETGRRRRALQCQLRFPSSFFTAISYSQSYTQEHEKKRRERERVSSNL